MARPDPTAPQVLARLDAGDVRGAAAWLVRGYSRDVYQLCASFSRESAEDLAQDVFGKAFANLAGFRRDASPRTWLLRIARNHCVDHVRAARRDLREPSGEAEPDDYTDESAALPADLLSRRGEVEQALAELSDSDRALVVLRFRNGFGYDELADVFGVRQGTVRMRLSRALGRMRSALVEPPVAAAAELAAVASLDADADSTAETFGGAPAGELRPGAAMPAPVAAASLPPAPEPPSRSAGLLSRFRKRPRPPMPAAPPRGEHPLEVFLAATDEGVPSGLSALLQDQAGRV